MQGRKRNQQQHYKKETIPVRTNNNKIVAQSKQPKLTSFASSHGKITRGTSTSNRHTIAVQCWAHTKRGNRCTKFVSSREGEPVPIPYCSIHLKSGDGCLKVVKHPLIGKCLVAR